jgi:RecB family exonuclease
MLSAPGESRECVELVRRLQRAAAEGVPFDSMAVLLRSPSLYRPHLDEALRRAGIPVWFERGARRPDPAGRALLALLACRVEGLSARRFGEYLSLGQVPPAEGDGEPPEGVGSGQRWVPAEDPLEADGHDRDHDHDHEVEVDHDHDREVEVDHDHDREGERLASLPRSPRRWERLLVDAVVVGGIERWERRLSAARASLEVRVAGLEPDAPAGLWLGRRIDDLDSLTAFALPLLRDLDALPEQAPWGEWLERLGELATRALRFPDRVLALLAALQPAAATGPVGLGEVRLVLQYRLGELVLRSKGRRYGRVFVGPIASARGRSFARVFVPGLAERLFPQKVVEDPILLDSQRRQLDVPLRLNSHRVADERTALRLAVGAASERVVLSWPRLDESQGRPRVPSFYGLETVRAAEGVLPGFGTLAERARLEGKARLARPAPDDPRLAIDDAEHDLSRLYAVRRRSRAEAAGTLRYLLSANPFLARSLRARYARWTMKRFTPFDGLIDPRPEGLAGLAEHQLDRRSFSATALQDFAACPYRFVLRSVHRLSPREEPEELEYIDPMSRGSLIHDVHFELLTQLRAEGRLPITRDSLTGARDTMHATLDAVARRYADELVPAIPRVWNDAIEAMRTDLGEWLRRMAEEARWVPHRFELSFGLKGRHGRDEHSTDEPALLDCGIRLRGSIDLIERDDDGHLRVTDYKTGRARVARGAVIKGGEALQPVLYALAAEQLFEDQTVDSGRLWYCTTSGGFAESTVDFDDEARGAADVLAASVGGRLERGALPALPREGACDWCDYRPVCGPAEEQRTRGKGQTAIDDLERLRGHR